MDLNKEIKEFRMDARSVDEGGRGIRQTGFLERAGLAGLLGPATTCAKVHPI